MRSIATCGLLGWSLVLWGCGAEEKKPVEYPPTSTVVPREEAADPSWDTGDRAPVEEDEDDAAQPASAERPKPQFTEGMSVNQAISAVPTHYDYIGIEQEVLAKPLVDIETYKECKVTPNDRFTVKIAVWDGRVVGADVKASTPAKQQCIDRVVRAIEYKERVESINTVEYSF